MTVNYTGLGLSVLFSMVMGFFWYGKVFGKTWCNLVGITIPETPPSAKMMMKSMFIGLVSSLLKAVIFYLFLEATYLFKGPSLESGLYLALLLWIGCSVPFELNRIAWEMKSWKLLVLNSAFEALRLAGLAAIYWFTRPV